MQYIKLKRQAEEVDLFSDDEVEEGTQPISHENYEQLIKYLEKKNLPAILPIQIAYVRIVDFGDTLTEILKTARKEQLKNRIMNIYAHSINKSQNRHHAR